jgi:hypothetical protein
MDWKIAGNDKICAITGDKLEIGDAFYSLLVKTSDEYQRKNISLKAKDKISFDDEEVFSWWKSRVPNPDKPKSQTLDFQGIFSFFLRLMDLEEPDTKDLQLSYLLSLLLMRKRMLKFVRSLKKDNQEYWIMSQPGSENEYQVYKPDLNDFQLQDLTEQISAIFNMESLD